MRCLSKMEDKELKKINYEEGKQIVRIDNFGVLLNKMDVMVELLKKIEKNVWFMDTKLTKVLAKLEKFK